MVEVAQDLGIAHSNLRRWCTQYVKNGELAVDSFRFIREHTDRFSVTKMCQVLKVSRSGYYQWIKYPESTRKIEDMDLKQ